MLILVSADQDHPGVTELLSCPSIQTARARSTKPVKEPSRNLADRLAATHPWRNASATTTRLLAEIWITRALLTDRRGNAKTALEYAQCSQENGPHSGTGRVNGFRRLWRITTSASPSTLRPGFSRPGKSFAALRSGRSKTGTGYTAPKSSSAKPQRKSPARQGRSRNSLLTPAVHLWLATAGQYKHSKKNSITSKCDRGFRFVWDE
jgi:hypothetical protein